VASTYIAIYVFHAADLDKDFGMRRDVSGTFRIGNSAVEIDRDSNVIYVAYHIRVPGTYLNY